jgi:uncharacterized RDD family membrane protein YckC
MNKSPREADTSVRVQTPEGIEYTLYPAGLPARACAYGIDLAFQWILLFTLIIIYFLVLDHVVGQWVIFLVIFALNWFYHVAGELLFRGQTPGKRLMGLRVVQSDGSPIGPGSSLLRNLLRFADGFMGLYIILMVSSIASRGFRRLGDWAADTLVIYTWHSQAPERGDALAWLAGIAPAAPGRALDYEEKQGVLMFARRYPLLGPERADEIAKPLADTLRPVNALRSEPRETATGVSDSEYLLGIAREFSGVPGDRAGAEP